MLDDKPVNASLKLPVALVVSAWSNVTPDSPAIKEATVGPLL